MQEGYSNPFKKRLIVAARERGKIFCQYNASDEANLLNNNPLVVNQFIAIQHWR